MVSLLDVPALQHAACVGELAHPTEPDCRKQGAKNPTRSLHGTPGLIDGHVTYIHWYFESVQCIGFKYSIGNKYRK